MSRTNGIDQETLQGLNENKAESLKLVFEHFYKRLVFYSVKKYTGNRDVSMDIVSTAFAKLFEMPSKEFTHIAELESLLYTIVSNLSIDYRRKIKRSWKQIPYDESSAQIEDQSDETIEFGEEVMHLVMEAIEQLPAQRKLVIQHKLLGHTSRQIAQLLQLTISTIDNHKRLAVLSIRQYLRMHGKYPLLSDY